MGIDRTKKQNRDALRAAARRIVSVIIMGVLIMASMYLYEYATTSERFAIDHVEFSGMTRVASDDVERLLNDLEGQNILLAPLDSYESRLETHPRIARVVMQRVLPNRVSCTVDEREPVALVFADRFLEVDGSGMVMEEDEFTPLLDLPVVTGVAKDAVPPGKRSEDAGLQRALEVLRLSRNLGRGFAEEISEIRISATGVTIRCLREDRVLVLGDSDYESRLKKYVLLKDAIADGNGAATMIDLRFDDQLVLRAHI